MKSSIVFFDNTKNSERGTYRGVTIFLPLLLLNYIFFSYYYKPTNHIKFCIALTVSSVLIVSAISVHNPNTAKKAIVFAALVGLVVYGVMTIFMYGLGQINFLKLFITVVYGTTTSALLGYLLYLIIQKWPGTFAYL